MGAPPRGYVAMSASEREFKLGTTVPSQAPLFCCQSERKCQMRTARLMTKAQISRDTLRYYERKGIITPPPRAANGYRDYPDSTVDVIRFIRLGQSVGLSLDVIRRA